MQQNKENVHFSVRMCIILVTKVSEPFGQFSTSANSCGLPIPKDLTGPSTSLSTIRFTSAPIDVYTRANLLSLNITELCMSRAFF